jgi:hypothetical protein
MSAESTAWLIAIAAGICSGIIAGVQPCVNTGAVVEISLVFAVATALVSLILPRETDADPVP